MGLDQNVNKREKTTSEEVAYWRKEHPLQGWFEDNYQIENCGEVILTQEVVDKLLEDLKDKELHATCGFFYGCRDSGEEVPNEWFESMIEEWSDIRNQVINNEDYEYYYTCWY